MPGTIDFSTGLWVDTNGDLIADAPAGSVFVNLVAETYTAYSDAARSANPTTGSTGGANSAIGTSGDDYLQGAGMGPTMLSGGNGNDTIFGGGDGGGLNGGADNDVITLVLNDGSGGVDAGAGDDIIRFGTSPTASGGINGGTGTDVLSLLGQYLGPFSIFSNVEILDSNGNNIHATVPELSSFNTIRYDAANLNALVTITLEESFTGSPTSLNLSSKLNDNGGRAAHVTGSSDSEAIGTGAGNDILSGGGGNDILNGGMGADAMSGGTGNDVFNVDNAGDSVMELAGEGTDTVYTSITFALQAGQEIENLIAVAGPAGLTLSGNAIANQVIGNAGNDTLYGNAGNDVLYGQGGNDFLIGGTGADTMIGGTGNDVYNVDNAGDSVTEATGEGTDTIYTSVNHALGAGQEVETLIANAGATGLTLTGNALANQLIGNSGNDVLFGQGGNDILTGQGGNDTLVGGAGADTMIGGAGNDVYNVDNAGDSVNEGAGQGADTVYASISYMLASGQEVENLIANAGATGLTLIGNAFANQIIGNTGSDVLNGGAGNDTLTGAAGNDTFVFNTALNAATNVDTITDFSAPADTINLSRTVFTAFATAHALTAAEFQSGAGLTAGTEADDRIVYNTTNGFLYYDADGLGGVAAVQFAMLTGHPATTNADFVVV